MVIFKEEILKALRWDVFGGRRLQRLCRKIMCFVTYYFALFNLYIMYINYVFKNKTTF